MWEKQSSVTCVAGLHRQEAKVTHNTGAFRPEALSPGFPAFPLKALRLPPRAPISARQAATHPGKQVLSTRPWQTGRPHEGAGVVVFRTFGETSACHFRDC